MKQTPVENIMAGKTYLFDSEEVTAVNNCLALTKMLKNKNKGRKYYEVKYYESMSFIRKSNNMIGFFYQEDKLIEIGN